MEKFKITKPIRLIELFAGYGSQNFALKYLGVNFESWKTCEWAIKSIQAYKDAHFYYDNTDYSNNLTKEEIFDYLANKGISSNYNNAMKYEQIKRLGEDKVRTIYNNIVATHNLVNISQVKGQDLEIVDTDKYDYILTYSFPCFTADSLVLTRNGYKRICDMDYGDFVLSHDNKYHKVVNIFNNGVHDIYKINAMGIDEIKTTYNHKFYVREKYRKGHKGIRCFREPKWKELKDLTKNDYLGIAINQECRAIVSNKLPTQNEHFWWIIGRYIGDGWIRQQGGIIICCDKKELQEITYHLDKLSWNYNIVEERTVYKIHIPKKILSDYVSQFGCGARNKHLTQDILDLPTWYLTPFIKGYISADGCFTNGVYKATSISRELIYGIAQCVAKVYKTPYRVYRVNPPKTKIIEDRLVNQNTWYQLVFKTEKRKQDKAFYEDGYIWYPINSIEYIGKNNVYDIEVENSHSFTIQNTIVHNCQDLSVAGLGKGMAKYSGTRSGMLWEVERILDEIVVNGGNLPQVLLMENVPQVHGTKNREHFDTWVDKLTELGYSNFWQDLNAKDFGVPQNRKRCFMISILGGGTYEFPKTKQPDKKLKDLLEEEVEEKYYLSDSKLDSISKWKAHQDPLKNIEQEKETCPCLTARGAGEEHSGMILINEDVYNLKRKLCNKLIENNMVREGDVIRHSYSNNRLKNGEKNMGRIESQECLSPTLDTRCDCLGVVVNDVSPLQKEVCNQALENHLIQPTDMIDYTYSNARLKEITQGNIKTKNSNNNDVSCTLATNCENLGVCVPSLYSKTEKELFTENGDIRRYINSDIIDKFEEGQMATTSYPNGYGHGPRTHNESIALNTIDKPSVKNNYRIRKLIPKECFRLMGVKDEDFERIAKNQSNQSLYHLAGDSIVVDVLMAIFEEMF